MFFYFFVILMFYSYKSHYNRVDIFLTLQKTNLQTYSEISLYLHNTIFKMWQVFTQMSLLVSL